MNTRQAIGPMFMRVERRPEDRCRRVKKDENRTGGQGVAGSNPVIPTHVWSFEASMSHHGTNLWCMEIPRVQRCPVPLTGGGMPLEAARLSIPKTNPSTGMLIP